MDFTHQEDPGVESRSKYKRCNSELDPHGLKQLQSKRVA